MNEREKQLENLDITKLIENYKIAQSEMKKAKEKICPIVKDTCLKGRCGWYSNDMCGIKAIAHALYNRGVK